MDTLTKVNNYRDRAKQLRAVAKKPTNLKAKRTLILVAEEYEQMASRTEQLAKATPSRPSEENKRAWGKLGFTSKS